MHDVDQLLICHTSIVCICRHFFSQRESVQTSQRRRESPAPNLPNQFLEQRCRTRRALEEKQLMNKWKSHKLLSVIKSKPKVTIGDLVLQVARTQGYQMRVALQQFMLNSYKIHHSRGVAFLPADCSLAHYQFRPISRSHQLSFPFQRCCFSSSKPGWESRHSSAGSAGSFHSNVFSFVLVFFVGKILLFASSMIFFCILYSLYLA